MPTTRLTKKDRPTDPPTVATVLTTVGDSYRLKAATRNHASRVPQEVPRQ